MDSERWKKIEDIFQDALDLSGAARKNFISEKTGDDAELRAEVEKLVARFEDEDEFLESPVWTDSVILGNTLKNRVASSLENEILPESSEKSFTGKRVGVYRLTDQIGKGGMGVVYAAERADGEFKQKVAVKLIKRGMDTDFIISRFRHERQILAGLNHPNIARLLDGGTTDDDLPFFVMEFIEGEPLLKYAEEKNLDLRQKLKIFLQVCAPIIYAHKRKIIHRDIKPSNILVNEDGEPKLLDFGIAKLLDTDSIHESLLPTATAMRLMTPEYASPEQVRGEEITPASDQYSLGVLLYELITGTRPYKFPSRSPHEIARVICEEIPSEPSSGSFGKILTGEVDVQFDEEFCKKIDRIVLKTLRKNPPERYASVEEFAADIERFLRNENVRAELFAKESAQLETSSEKEKARDTEDFARTTKENIVGEKVKKVAREKMISPRWRGVKQGIFITILSIVSIPVLVLITVTAILPPQILITTFVLFFLSGFVRMIYALLFESGKKESEFSSQTENEIAEAETKLINSSAPRETIVGNHSTFEKTVESEKAIAVLPFKNLNNSSADDTDESEFLNIGLADSLITRLSNVRQLIVRPTNSVLRFAAENIDAFTAGDELKVDYVLTGNVLRAEKKIRVSIQLLDIKKKATVWAERFNENLSDVLEIEDSITAKVVEALVPKLTGEERRQIEKRGTESAEAHEAYLRGRSYWNSFTEEGFRQAKFYFEKAIELDPNYALAYTGLTDYYLWLGAYAMIPPKDCFPPARKAAEKAVALDGESAEAYSALGFAQLCDSYDWEKSEKNALRAIELNPNYISTYIWYASHHFGREKYDEGLRLVEQAIKLDPLSFQSHNSLAYGLYFARRFDEAIAKAKDNITRFPEFSLSYNALSLFLRRVGRTEESLEASNRAVELSTNLDRMPTLFARASALTAAGKRTEAEDLLREIEAKYAGRYISPREYIIVYSYLGEKEKALDALEKAFADGELLIWLESEPAIDIIRNDPRYRAIIKKLNLSPRESDWKSKADREQKSIAVLPFRHLNTLSGEDTGGTDFLSVGLADALITRISNVRQLIVRPTSSVLKFGAGETDSLDAGKVLNVRFVVEGNIVRTEKRIRVSVQLLDVENRSTVWAEKFDEDLTDYLDLEDSISAKVVESLLPKVSGEDQKQLEKRGTKNADAHEAYLRGRYHFNFYTDEGFQKAIRYYEKAIELDPNYALAYAAIADYYVWQSVYDVNPVSPKAKEFALKAIALDDRLSEAYAALGLALLYGEYDWQKSEENIRYAIELNPNNSVAHLWYSHCLFTQNRFPEGTRHISRALDLDPLSYINHNTYSFSFYFQRRYDEALKLNEELLANYPNIPQAHFSRGSFLDKLGRPEEAMQAMQNALKLEPESLTLLYGLASALAGAGRRRDVEELIEKIKTKSKKRFFSNFQTAIVYCYLNEIETAFEYLEKAFESRESLLVWTAIEPSLDPLRGDARYQKLLEKMNYPLAGKDDFISRDFEFNKAKNKFRKKESGFPSALKYVLAAVVALGFGFLIYNFITNFHFNYSGSTADFTFGKIPVSEQWKNNFASMMNIRRLNATGIVRRAVVSPDGKQIAYVSGDNQTQSLRIRETDSETERELVAPEANFYLDVRFSPDGKYIYYLLDRTASPRILSRIQTGGGASEKVSEEVFNSFAISSDGQKIAYDFANKEKKNYNIRIADLVDGKTVQNPQFVAELFYPDYYMGSFTFSPDNGKLMYAVSKIEASKEAVNLFVYDFETQTESQLTTQNFSDITGGVWRNGGEEIVICATEENSTLYQLWLVSFPSGEVTHLTNDFYDYSGASLTADSSVLATVKKDSASNLWTSGLAESSRDFDLKTKQVTNKNSRQDGIEGVNWTKDGRILYISSANGENAVATIKTDGTDNQTIPVETSKPAHPYLTADNRYLVLADEKDQKMSIRRFDLQTGEAAEISSRYAVTPTISPDDQFVFYTTFSATSKTTSLHRKSLLGGDETEVTHQISVSPAISPDGKFVACLLSSKETGGEFQPAIFPSEKTDGKPLKIIRVFQNGNLENPQSRSLAWSPDGKFLYFVNSPNNISNIFRVAIDGDQKPVQMTFFTSDKIFDFAIANDGKTVVLSRGATSTDIVLFKKSK